MDRELLRAGSSDRDTGLQQYVTESIIEAITLVQEVALGSPPNNVAQRITFVFIGGGIQRAKLELET